jgi:DNA helicase II / ATP-dependent DNA helicase PcrA
VTESLSTDLTPAQHEAVEFFEGPLQVLAGPGSGKTRVITRRIARLIERGVEERSVLAITFTNRAAREMQERVEKLLPGTRVWITTFHRFCANVLRRRARLVGLESNFTILDSDDQRQAVKRVLEELDYSQAHATPAKIRGRISQLKNKMISAEDFCDSIEAELGEPFDRLVAQVYPRYQELLRESNAVDFDDLLLHVVKLFYENPELRADYDEQFRFLLVDEYQDTNSAQYQIVRALSMNVPNVCVTGDPDQSIYGWRGADIHNILSFERDFPGTRLIRLEANFRSTGLILNAAGRLIDHNRMRKAKVLFTDDVDGEPVRLLKFKDDTAEADGIVDQIRELHHEHGLKWSDIAVFYRVNSLSRQLELAFRKQRVPSQISAGLSFFERAEVKDLLAYLRVIENPADLVAFRRIVNKPPRGLGAKTINKLQNWAVNNHVTLMEAARSADAIEEISRPARAKLKAFVRMIESFDLANFGSLEGLLNSVVEKTALHLTWADADPSQAQDKRANVNELIAAAASYDAAHEDEDRDDNRHSISGFLETTSLVNDGDLLDPQSGKVTLMTIHAAKGLEYPAVFVVGLEHGLIPHERAMKSNEPIQLEEERRLLFVAMTRAEKWLYLTTAKRRSSQRGGSTTIVSSFLQETIYETVDLTGDEPVHSNSSKSNLPERDQAIRDKLRESMADSGKPMLMTAAALLKGTREAAELPVARSNTDNSSSASQARPAAFDVGMRVRHPRYGIGTVVETSGSSRMSTVTVEFSEANRNETFVASRCPLQPIGVR